MAAKGYASIADFKGKLKPFDKANKPKDPVLVGTGGAGSGGLYALLAALLLMVAVLLAREFGLA